MIRHDRIGGYINESRVHATRALAQIALELDQLDGDDHDAADQVFTALGAAHKHLTTALAFVNADCNRQAAR